MSKNPNEVLAARIAAEMKSSELILSESIEKFTQLLKEGTMKESYWLNLLQKKIDAQNLNNETKISTSQ